MNKEKIISIVVLVLVVAGVVGFMVYGSDKASTGEPVVKAEPVAIVNGVEITEETFNTQLASAITALKAQGTDTTSTSSVAIIRTQVLDNMIASELVNQGVLKAGIKTSDADVEKQFQALLTQAGDAEKLKTQLTAANLTEAQLRENIAKQLAVQAFLLQSINTASIVVTDAEVKKFYDDNTKGQTGVPAFKDVSEQIKQQLTLNKQQVLVNEFITKLRASADVKVNLK